MRQGSAPGAETVEELQQQLHAARAENARLREKIALLSRRGRQPCFAARVAAVGAQIHRLRTDGVIWYTVARRMSMSQRQAPKILKAWREAQCARLQSCARTIGPA